MLGVNLSTLGQQDLRRLLTVARARGQTALAAQVLAEMEARTSQPGGWRAASATISYAQYEPPGAPRATEASPRRGRGAIAATALIGFVVAGLAWGLSPHDGASPDQATLASAKPTPRVAAALAEIEQAPRVEPVVEAPATSAAPDGPSTSPIRTASRNPCYDEPTPADRLICGYPAVAARDRRLRQIYAQAIVAGGDPRGLENEQASWKAQTDRISEWKDLAEAYDRRIAALQSAVNGAESAP